MDKDKQIIIVESPTKAKTIRNILGRKFTLVASYGHIKDLPKSTLGIEVENNFQPRYIKIKGKGKIIKEIVKKCKNSSKIYLASDPDREGEAIAKHIAEELNSDGRQIKRVLFYEITPEYIDKALKKPAEINENLVDAHKARRVLDRIVGYFTSPILWQILRRGLSAGRVQSVALRIICEREGEIKSFTPIPYWTADAEFKTNAQDLFKASLWKIDGVYRKIASKDELIRLENLIKPGTKFTVSSFRITNPKRFPPPPFITSTLEQEASKHFYFSPKKTLQIAQRLYEGITLPEGSVGLITYMRTDSIRVNASTLEDLRNYIAAKYGEEYLNKNVRVFKDRKASQGAHEAIRPTKVSREPDAIKDNLTPEQYKIYKLIYNRFVSSQMSEARYQAKEVILNCLGIDFRAEEIKPIFLGYQLVAGDTIQRGSVPDLKVGEPVEIVNIKFEEKTTEPPPRYTEASLIKKLEENGVRRPSTLASTLQTL